MRNFFPGYYQPTDKEISQLWNHGLFVFDTNVLLNLYSYPEAGREAFLSVLHKISERIWIPYQVALEFHRNRLNRIKSSNKSVLSLRDKIRSYNEILEHDFMRIEFEKRNTGILNISERLTSARTSNSQLVEALDAACKKLPGTSLDDPIARKLSDLFDGKTGEPPENQDLLDTITKDGEDRYAKKIPPGYKDAGKNEQFYDRGLTYDTKFGDLILWRQTISHVLTSETKNVVFVTGDRKEDWWDEDEGKIRGPRPELILEFKQKTKADNFWIYSVDAFVEHAKKHLKTNSVTAEAIEQIKETTKHVELNDKWTTLYSLTDNLGKRLTNKWENIINYKELLSSLNDKPGNEIEKAVKSWLININPDAKLEYSLYCDFCLEINEKEHGFGIVQLKDFEKSSIQDRVKFARTLVKNGKVYSFTLVLVLDEIYVSLLGETMLKEIAYNLADYKCTRNHITVILGIVKGENFVPVQLPDA